MKTKNIIKVAVKIEKDHLMNMKKAPEKDRLTNMIKILKSLLQKMIENVKNLQAKVIQRKSLKLKKNLK